MSIRLAVLSMCPVALFADAATPYGTWENARREAAKGDSRAQGYVAHRLYWGDKEVPRNREAAVFLAQQSVKSGNAEAADVLGSAYAHGVVVGRDFDKAFYYAAMAAGRGHANGQYNCAIAYLYGQGSVVRNPEVALALLRSAAGKNHPMALYSLGLMTLRGEYGVSKDTAVGLRMLERATVVGSKAAFLALGEAHHGKIGDVPKDMAQSLLWHERGEKAGNRACAEALGQMYWFGHDVPKNPGLAVKHFSAAADLGSAGAHVALAEIYLNGIGAAQDLNEGAAHLLVAVALGDSRAKEMMKRVDAKVPGLADRARVRADALLKAIPPDDAS